MAKEQLDSNVLKYSVTIRTLTDMLGTAPSDPTLYADFLVSKALDTTYKAANADEKKKIKQAMLDHELTLLPGQRNTEALDDSPQSVKDVLGQEGTETKGKTIFRANPSGLIMLDYQIKGFFKAAAKSVSSMYQPESRVDKWLFVNPREIAITRQKIQIPVAEGVCERPLRTEDKMTGVNRVCIAVSEIVKPGAEMSFTVLILPKGFSAKSSGGQFVKEEIRQWVEYGLFSGLGQWRNASFGAFDIVSFKEQPITWKEALEIRRAQLKAVGAPELAEALV